MTSTCSKCGYTGDNFYPYLLSLCKTCHYAYQKDYRGRIVADGGMTASRKYALRKRYGLSVDQYLGLIAAQSGLCAACGEDPTLVERSAGSHRRLHVDHDHATGVVRGMLCNGCNRALGLLNDNEAKIQGLLSYLQRSRQAVAS